MVRDDDNRLIVEGKSGRVEFAVRKSGSMPAKKDLAKIKKKDKQSYRHIRTLFMRLAKVGKDNLSNAKFSDLEDEIYEFKRHPYRLGCFFIENRCLLTHVFDKKPGDAYISEQIKKAKIIRKEHVENWE